MNKVEDGRGNTCGKKLVFFYECKESLMVGENLEIRVKKKNVPSLTYINRSEVSESLRLH